ncbi:MAG: AAA family ATPase, partial [Terricaulis sp.]
MTHYVSPRLAGRDQELGLLLSALDEADRAKRRVVLVGAEAGGGKSRLVSEFAQRVGNRAMTLRGGCVAQDVAELPYAPIAAALRDLSRQAGGERFRALVGSGAGDLAHLFPEFGAVEPTSDPAAARVRLFNVIANVFAEIAGKDGLVLILEDLHWADRATLDLVRFLVDRLDHTCTLLIATYRTDEIDVVHPMRALASMLARLDGVDVVDLARLTRRDVAIQIEGILTAPPSPELVNGVYARSEGVPLFTETLVSAEGAIREDLPGSLRDSLLGTVRALPAATQRILEWIALGGGEVGHDLLAAATRLGDSEIADALRPAIAANALLDESASYRFRHGLFGEAVRDAAIAADKRIIHRAYADAFDKGCRDAHWPAGALARHCQLAGYQTRALAAAAHAASEAKANFAHPQRLEMLTIMLGAWDEVAEHERPAGLVRSDILLEAGDAACWAVEPERGIAFIEEALKALEPERHDAMVAACLLQRAAMRQQSLDPAEIGDLKQAVSLA